MSSSVYVLECGDGDTILVEDNESWGIVDANFTPTRGARFRVEDLLVGVERLRFVCVTHFDLDHLKGLVSFLEDNFVDRSPGGDIIWRIDEIIIPFSETTLKAMERLKRRAAWFVKTMPDSPSRVGDFAKEVYLLFDFLWEMLTYERGHRPKISSPGPGKVLMFPGNRPESAPFGEWVVFSLGPSEETSEIYARQIEEQIAGRRKMAGLFREIEKNETSRVLALVNKTVNRSVLLCGDATPDEIGRALCQWDGVNSLRNMEAPVPFEVVKISHHGASSCHCEEIYDRYSTSNSIGLISALDKNNHPDGTVISKMHTIGMDHRVTGSEFAVEVVPKRGSPMGLVHFDISGDIRYDVQNGQVFGGKRSRYSLFELDFKSS